MRRVLTALMVLAAMLVVPIGSAGATDGSITGHVWQDDNGDGFQQAGEPDLDGVRVFAITLDFITYFSVVTTDPNGDYVLADVPHDLLLVGVAPADGGIPILQDLWLGLGDIPPGWVPTLDPDGVATPYEALVDATGGSVTGADFAFQPGARIELQKQTDPLRGDALVSAPGATYGAIAGTPAPAPGGETGVTVDVGLACPDNDPITDNLSGKIALAERGLCAFTTKAADAAAAGASGIIVYNSEDGGDAPLPMFVDAEIPAVGVTRTDGLALLGNVGEQVTLAADDLRFEFDIDDGTETLSLHGSAAGSSGLLAAGLHTVVEQPVLGWVLDTASCVVSDLVDGTPDEVAPDDIVLGDGDLAICTFSNVPDTDNDSVRDTADLCPGTELPEPVPPRLKKNRFFANGDGVFVDAKGTPSGITVFDTFGCSAEQIIEQAGLGAGHRRFGITRSALLDWIDANS